MKQWMMIRSGIKKNRSASIILVVLMLISTIFLNIGLNVLTKVDGYVAEKNKEIHGPDFALMLPEKDETDALVMIQGMEGYEASSIEKILHFEAADFYNEKRDKKSQTMQALLLDISDKREYSNGGIIDEGKELKSNSIVLPYYLKVSSKYQTGDKMELTVGGKAYKTEIYGFSEDVMFATPFNFEVFRCLLAPELYETISKDGSLSVHKKYINVKLQEGYKSDKFEQEFTNLCVQKEKGELLSAVSLNYESMKVGVKATISIVMAILVIFAILITCVAMVIIRFTISSYIEEDIKNLGSMEAIGFTCGMLQRSLIFQFWIISFIGFLIGMVVSIPVNILLGTIVESTMGLRWSQDITPMIFGITLGMLLLIVTVTTVHISRRIRKITPTMALRNGIETFHYKKNYLPLEHSRGNVHWLMSLKEICNNRKQNIVIALITTLMTFSVMMCIGLYESFVGSESNIKSFIGQESPQIIIQDFKEDYQEYFNEIAKKDGIERTLRYSKQNVTLNCNENRISVVGRICNDYEKVELDIVAEGRNPQYENEIALSYRVADVLKVGIGDVLTMEVGTSSFEFVVVGLMQHMCYLGDSVALTEEGMIRCMPSFEPRSLYIYTKNHNETAIKEVISSLQEEVNSRGGEVINYEEGMNTTLKTLKLAIKAMCIAICGIAAVITILVLYYLLKMKLIKDKLNLGISKAIGFTTRQLMIQIILTFIPIIIIGILLGSCMAYVGINPLCVFMFNSLASVRQLNMEIPWTVATLTAISIILVAMLETVLVSLRIRKIEVRGMVTE